MWDLPGTGLEPVPLALAGGFLTIVPPGKPHHLKFNGYIFLIDVEKYLNSTLAHELLSILALVLK